MDNFLVWLLFIGIFFSSNLSYSVTTESPIDYYEVVNVNSKGVLNIRESHHHRSQKIGEIPANEKCVAYLEQSQSHNKWVMIHYNGTTGWVNSRYLKKTQQCEHKLITKYYDVTQVAQGGALNIRKIHHHRSSKLGKIPANGKCIAYLNESHKHWVMINYQAINGWVNSRYLQENNNCPSVSNPSTPTLDKLAQQTAKHYQLDDKLICAIINQESRWNPNAVSPKGAIGLMQIMPATGKEACNLNEEQLYNPAENIKCGVYYFNEQLKRFGSEELALCAYNAGPHRVVERDGCPPFRETKRYVRNILTAWRDGQTCPNNVTSAPIQKPVIRTHLSAKGIADVWFTINNYRPQYWWVLVCKAIDVVYFWEILQTQPDAVGKPAITPSQQKIWLQILDTTVNDIYEDEKRLKQQNAWSRKKIRDKIKQSCPKK